MNLLTPTAVTDSNFVASNVPETDYPAWNAATNYSVGTFVIRTQTHRIYQNLIAGVDATTPEVAAKQAPPRWLDVGPTNRWAIYDDVIGTTTTNTGSITATINIGQVGAVAFVDIKNASSITATLLDQPGGTQVYSKTVSDLDRASLTDFFDFFYEPYQQLDTVLLSDLPTYYPSAQLSFTVAGTGQVGFGALKAGNYYSLGGTEYGASLGIVDYSVKSTDSVGRVSLTKRGYASTFDAKFVFDKAALSRVYRLLAGVRATPTVYVLTDVAGYETGILFGVFQSFSIDLAMADMNRCTLRVESFL